MISAEPTLTSSLTNLVSFVWTFTWAGVVASRFTATPVGVGLWEFEHWTAYNYVSVDWVTSQELEDLMWDLREMTELGLITFAEVRHGAKDG